MPSTPTAPNPAQSTTDTLASLLTHLVRMPTVTTDQATNRAGLDWIEEQLHGLPLHIKRYEHGGHPSLVATTTGAKDPKSPRLWLAAHLDVVPGAPSTFEPHIIDGRLHGHGVHDMKFAIAVFVALLQELGPDLANYDLGLMITSDEEIGGFHGVKWLLDEHGYRGTAAILPDSGGNWEIEMGSKGIMWWELTATGQAAHASRTWEGVNAIDLLTRFVDNVRGHLKTEPCGDPAHQHTTVNFANIVADNANNQVPGSATAHLDIRFTPDITMEDIGGWMDQARATIPGVEAEVILSDPPYLVKQNGAVALFERLTQEVTGHGITPAVAHGSSDARHFAHYDISTVNICPTGSGFHFPVEWVDLDDLTRFYDITRRFVAEWCAAKP